jgi:hypothetical protein
VKNIGVNGRKILVLHRVKVGSQFSLLKKEPVVDTTGGGGGGLWISSNWITFKCNFQRYKKYSAL